MQLLLLLEGILLRNPFLERDACLLVREVRLLLVAPNRGSEGAQERAGANAALLRTKKTYNRLRAVTLKHNI